MHRSKVQRKSKFLRLSIPEESGGKVRVQMSELARSLVRYPHSNSTRNLKTAANFYLNSAVHSPLRLSRSGIDERDDDSLAHTYAVPNSPAAAAEFFSSPFRQR